jgi:hypothetical protein
MVSDILDEELGAKPISSIGGRRPLRIVNDPRAA